MAKLERIREALIQLWWHNEPLKKSNPWRLCIRLFHFRPLEVPFLGCTCLAIGALQHRMCLRKLSFFLKDPAAALSTAEFFQFISLALGPATHRAGPPKFCFPGNSTFI
jgi:hypothetical protein